MKNRIAALLLTGTLLTAALAGCGGGKSTPEASASAPAEGQSVSSVESMASVPAAQPEPETESTQEESLAEQPAEIQHLVEFPLEEPFSISISMSTTPSLTGSGLIQDAGQDLGWAKWLHNRTGADIQVDLYSFFDSADKQNLMIASGDYTDVIVGSLSYSGGVDGAVEEGVLTDISEYAAYMPDYMNALYSNVNYVQLGYSTDFHLTAFYGLNDSAALPDYGPVIRQDWLDAQGLEKPVTYDDLHEVLTVFKNAYGATLWLTSYGGVPGDFSGGYGVKAPPIQMGSPFFQINGEVKYGPMEDGYKKYLTTLSKWYADGLIYKDFYTYVDSNTNPPDDLVLNNQMGLYGLNTQDIPNRYSEVVGNNPDIVVVGAYDPVENEGDTLHFSESRGASATGGYCISTHCEDPVLVARWADYIYSEEGQLLSNYGVEGLTFDYNAEGKPELNDMIFNNPDGLPEQLAITKYTTFSLVGVQDDYRQYARFTDAQWEAARDIWPLGDDAYVIPTGVQMTSEENTTYANTYSDIGTYVGQYTLQAIMGDVDIDATWDEYVAAIEAMNIATCIQQQQSALDRYNAA